MSEMVERVGRAIDPHGWETQDGLRQYSPDYWASETQTECRKELIARARRAIAAMREPTDSQCFAGAKALAMEMQAPSATLMGIGYSAMIGAVLGETP